MSDMFSDLMRNGTKVLNAVERDIDKTVKKWEKNVKEDIKSIGDAADRDGVRGAAWQAVDVLSPGHQMANRAEELGIIGGSEREKNWVSLGGNLAMGSGLGVIKDASDLWFDYKQQPGRTDFPRLPVPLDLGAPSPVLPEPGQPGYPDGVCNTMAYGIGEGGGDVRLPPSRGADGADGDVEVRVGDVNIRVGAGTDVSIIVEDDGDIRVDIGDGDDGVGRPGLRPLPRPIDANPPELPSKDWRFGPNLPAPRFGGGLVLRPKPGKPAEDDLMRMLKKILSNPNLAFEDMMFLLMRAVMKAGQKDVKNLAAQMGKAQDASTAERGRLEANVEKAQAALTAASGGDKPDPQKIAAAQGELNRANRALQTQASDAQNSRNDMMETLKDVMQKTSEMQQAMSAVLNSMHETSMSTIRNIK